MQNADKAFHRRWKSRILAQAAFLFFATGLQADITVPNQAPPQADPQNARVLRGKQTTILLRGHGGGGGSLAFRIVQHPEHGSLSPVRLIGDNRAEIVYGNDGTESIESDRFRYVVRANDGRISSAAEVRIFVEDAPARMVVPARIEFDEIEAGESNSRVLAITNEGGGILEGRVSASAPWRLSAPAYRVGPGQTENVSVRFEPDEGRQFIGQITLTAASGIETIVQLTGAATSPIQAEPDHLEIAAPNNLNGPRQGSIALTNQTERVLRVNLEASSNIQAISEITLAPRERKTVSIVIVPESSTALHEDVAFVGAGFRGRLHVDAAAASNPPAVTDARAPADLISKALPPTTVNAAPSKKTPLSSARLREDASAPVATPPTTSAPSVPVKVNQLDRSNWELRWTQPKVPVTKYRVDERFVSLDSSGGLQTAWREIAPVETVVLGKEVVAHIKEMEPKNRHFLRVTAFGPSELTLWESPVVALTPTSGSLRFHPPWLLLLVITLVVFALLRWRANRAPA